MIVTGLEKMEGSSRWKVEVDGESWTRKLSSASA